MDQIPAGVGSALLNFGILIGLAITQVSSLKKKVQYAHHLLEDLNRDFKDTERQINSLCEFLELAEFSPERHHQCKNHLHDLLLKANKLINLIDYSDLGEVRRNIDKINGTITAIRQEMILAIIISNRDENRIQTREVREDIQRVNRNLTGTDAKQIRKIYRVVAMELMYQSNFVAAGPATGLPSGNPQAKALENSNPLVAPIGITEALPSRSISGVQIDFDIPASTDLADVTEAFSRILGRSALDRSRSTYSQFSEIVELPA
ncbi:hypothetical protein TWF102_006038 [Orbilia oligospora]|uniref:Uncharacterized protein n=1 Tax=Orbilia oligospora TaxID=2813651 RepID=A0A7C8J6P5_ORBOL|nr:hypothetical protein TWF102_006038 [Orbilia oligospora]KAF3115135.1 hypothetical protein TWF706_007248 [Orbilia oligospora]KAF3121436.1 hypothetical protein TWF703_001927 [Orbilia oligospora]KAF3144242.1 hypothetical protein TWF594_004778 [Orbilia oligospora]